MVGHIDPQATVLTEDNECGSLVSRLQWRVIHGASLGIIIIQYIDSTGLYRMFCLEGKTEEEC